MDSILEIKNLKKYYKEVKAVDGIDFSVQAGSCFGLLGPNGAGKTTTIELIETILKPDAGTILFQGKPIDHSFKNSIGIQFQTTALQEFLTVRETLELFAKLYPKKKPIDEIIAICSLEDIIKRDNRKLSGGQRQRMLLGIALINDPDILFLDEPTTGLDPQARRNFWQLIENIKNEKKTVILTTHYMEEAEVLCDDIAVMDHGKIIEQGHPALLLEKYFQGVILKIPSESFPKNPSVSFSFEKRNGYVHVVTRNVEKTIHELIREKVPIEGLKIDKPNLDDLFITLTGSSLRT
ncbi:MAG: ABC transporter ATP-binding protein [Spirochaetales bacterium]|nr:ABC transporter ATP-binding protein [Spirochaetales bacterium]